MEVRFCNPQFFDTTPRAFRLFHYKFLVIDVKLNRQRCLAHQATIHYDQAAMHKSDECCHASEHCLHHQFVWNTREPQAYKIAIDPYKCVRIALRCLAF